MRICLKKKSVSETFRFCITRSQLAVFDPDLVEPFNDWRQVHVDQGFTWRPNSVSFGTLIDIGDLPVEVRKDTKICLLPETIRAISVPYIVPESGKVGHSDMADEAVIPLPPGPYALVFETAFLSDDPEDGTWVRLTFIACESAKPSILRQDAELNPPDVLDMHAVPA